MIQAQLHFDRGDTNSPTVKKYLFLSLAILGVTLWAGTSRSVSRDPSPAGRSLEQRNAAFSSLSVHRKNPSDGIILKDGKVYVFENAETYSKSAPLNQKDNRGQEVGIEDWIVAHAMWTERIGVLRAPAAAVLVAWLLWWVIAVARKMAIEPETEQPYSRNLGIASTSNHAFRQNPSQA